ncbi:hypothetical protein E3N88_39012 [Mikania micrantha]|uniref:Homeobox domain-containing protein n=1 Tax=Mikania micrantha TaxID=192012 RepID=A0A5N6LWF3_9ASTR|nr:hypothetical protein E3N88_39012 [Mikania micrantha]
MENESVCNNGIVLELTLRSSSMVEQNSTNTINKPCNPNLDPSLTLALSCDRDHGVNKKKPASDHGGLHRTDSDSVSGSGNPLLISNMCVKREREVKSEEQPQRVLISTTSEVDDEEDDDNCGNGRKKLRLTKAQSALLEEAFKDHSTLHPKQKQELARELKLRPRQVEVWFQNRRARTKLKQIEVDCEYLKKCCEKLKDENTRLHKELQELKTLKSINSNTSHAATLSMCPSCKYTMAPKPCTLL